MLATVVFEKNWDAIHAKAPDGSRLYRYIVNTGSSRSSKTGSLIQVCDLYARSNPNKRLTAWRDTKKDCKDTILKDALTYFKMWGSYKQNQAFNITESIFTYNTASTFEIHGTDDEEKVMGLNKAVTWLNEPYKISRATFDQLDMRTEDFVLIDWNPKKNHWIDDIIKDPRTIVIHSTFKDNPFCPDEQRTKILSYQTIAQCDIVLSALPNMRSLLEEQCRAYDIETNPSNYTRKQLKELARCRSNEDKNTANSFNWSVYGLGEKAERPNRILHFTEIPDEEYKRINSTIYNGVDWGTVDPWGILEAKYYDGTLYLHELNYYSENQVREKLTSTELAQIGVNEEGIVTWMFGKLHINKTNRIVCDTNRPLKIAGLRRSGWSYAIPANKAPGSIIDGINLLNDLKVCYTASSENLKYEQENYSWLVDRYGVTLDEPEDANNHLIDPARYIAQMLQSLGVIRMV